jgi:hypothetical protein
MKSILLILFLFISFFTHSPAHAFRLGIAGGSAGYGNGHANAADFRSVSSYKVHATISTVDVSLAPSQALVGRYFAFKSGAFIIPAAGFILDSNGSGPGMGSTFGWTAFCFGLCLSLEFQSLVGIGPNRQLTTGHAARIGLDYSN